LRQIKVAIVRPPTPADRGQQTLIRQFQRSMLRRNN